MLIETKKILVPSLKQDRNRFRDRHVRGAPNGKFNQFRCDAIE
jgi:hypothetical protein